MNTTRNDKIARLPRTIRDQLSQRIDNAEPGRKLAAWLNTLPEVQSVLAEQFEGRPINEQNITEWRQGGYQDWLELQENRALTLYLAEHSETMETDLGAKKISEAYAAIAAADFIRTTKTKLRATTDTNQRLACLNDTLRQLSRLRRDDHRAGHLKLRQDSRNDQLAAGKHAMEEKKQAAEQVAEAERRRQMLAYFKLQPNLAEEARQRGNTDWHRDVAAFVLELEHKLKIGLLGRKSKEFTTDEFEEFDEIATRNEVAQGLTSDFPSERRVPRVPNPPEPIIGRVPDTTPTATAPTPAPTHHASQVTSHSAAPIPLANEAWPLPAEIRLEDHEKMPGIRVNQAAGECSKMLRRERN